MKALWIASTLALCGGVGDQELETLRQMYQHGDFAQVVDQGTALLARDPENAEVHHLVGRALVDAGYNLRAEQAIGHLQRCLRDLPADHWMLGWSHVYIGMAHEMAGRKQSARDAYELAIALDVTPECTAAGRRRLALLVGAAADPVIQEMQKLYDQKNFTAVVQTARRVLGDAPAPSGGSRAPGAAAISDPLFYHLLGRALIDQNNPAERAQAIEELQTSLSLADGRLWIAGWNHFYLGRAYELSNDLETAQKSYERAVALAATSECVSSARFRLRQLGRDPYAGWLTHEMAHVILRYPPDSPLIANPADHGRRLDAAHQAIARFLNVSPERRIQVYVYTDAAQGKDITGQELGWADRENQVVHQHLRQTPGHEIAHCLAHYLAPAPYCDSAVLNEGLAVYLDQDAVDKHQVARERLAAGSLPDFAELERTFRTRDDAYPLAGSFVGFLLERYSRDGLSALWRDSAHGQYEPAFQRHYRKSSTQLSEEWKQYLRETDR